ncbi:hypothetical protein [Bradyrhizobium yuanmingense]|uniref:hypothetical protein n=1 Tax=Bradyrhizobium yuanmingense TaxID=108015 RepID=UPI0035124CA4
MQTTERLHDQFPAQPESNAPSMFESWLGDRAIAYIGTNAGAVGIPFQDWRRFKEAFAPELVARAIRESEIPVTRCLDPFGGSGTSALACQFLGVYPVTIEVNPYLADLIEAKLTMYDLSALTAAFKRIVAKVDVIDVNQALTDLRECAPPTFVEPGLGGKYVFRRKVIRRFLQYRCAIEKIRDESVRRLFRVLLGSIAIPVSNVTISGKGRRYRGGWENRDIRSRLVDDLFAASFENATKDIASFGHRLAHRYSLLRGDARTLTTSVEEFDLAVFSPPYPNSADYTDVYNVELWVLGYLRSKENNVALRAQTLSSHVQLSRHYAPAPSGSNLLRKTLKKLVARRNQLWHRDIPAMVGAYFSDMQAVLTAMYPRLKSKGKVFMVVGESRYAGIKISTAPILSDIAESIGYQVRHAEPFRSMRVAPQQGGKPGLAETLIVLQK